MVPKDGWRSVLGTGVGKMDEYPHCELFPRPIGPMLYVPRCCRTWQGGSQMGRIGWSAVVVEGNGLSTP